MKSRALPVALLLSMLPLSGRALAATADHQQCFKIKDPAAKALYTADLVPTDSAFVTASGCQIKVPAKYLCIDVQKTNVTPAPPGADDGQPAQKSLCYKVKCPKGTQTVDVEDQFGSRTVTVVGSSLLCAPIPVPTTTTSTTTTSTTTTTTLAPGACNTVADCPTVANGTAACSMSICYVGSCDPNYADCDGQYATGCEVDTSSDAGNCGNCGNTCSFQNAGASCSSSTCQMGACDTGYSDCDANPSNGCEQNIVNDVNNCGSCNNVCSAPHSTSFCGSGVCGLYLCDLGYSNCNSDQSDGCEADLATDPNNCGSCSALCLAPTPNCVSNTCVP